MEPIGTTSIKEKLTRSRSLWLGAANEKFLQRLYNVLDVNSTLFRHFSNEVLGP